MSNGLQDLLETLAERGEDRSAADVYSRAVVRNRRRTRVQRGLVSCAAVAALAGGAVVLGDRDESGTMIESTADSEQNGTLPATSPSATTPSSTSAASATIPGVVWWFASEYGVPGTAVSVEIAGLADYVGEPVDFYFASVAGDASAGAGSGVVDESGRTKVDFYVPNRFEEDEMDVEPGEYVVSGALKSRRGPDSFESRLEVRRAVPGESYRTVLGYGCAEVIWFDTKLWFAADEGVERATIPASAGTIRLIDDSRAVFTSTETGDVALRLSTPEEAAAFGPPTTYCHG